MAYPSLVTGQTAYVSGLRADVLTQTVPGVDLGGLATSGQPLRLIALGGSLTAGVRNGGLYREGQLTAYPNLVARQMGIAGFESPTFGPQEANGTGFYVYDPEAGNYPRWKEVVNQKAVVQAGDPPVFSQYLGKVDNFAVPGISGTLFNRLWYPANKGVNGAGKRWFGYQPYLWRYLPNVQNEKDGLLDYMVGTKTYDLFMLEEKAEEWLEILRRNKALDESQFLWDVLAGNFYYGEIANRLLADGKKGVLFTLPSVQDYAFMQWYPTSDLKAKAAVIDITYGGDTPKKLDSKTNFYMMPTANVAKLFMELKVGDFIKLTLTDADVMDQWEFLSASPHLYNEKVLKLAQQLNLAVVDLNAIYRQIHQGTYQAEGGLRIDGSPKGNFFSSDGTYPTAIGQAVIANEVINALNRTYKSRIPLINVSEFAQQTGAR